MSRALGVALVGASGYWGRRILANLKEMKTVRIAALVSHRTPPESLRSLAPPEGALLTHDVDAVLSRPDIPAVVVATPTGAHFAAAERAIGAGKHIFLEKPPALSSREVRALLRAARRRGVVVVVDHVYLFSPHLKKMDALIRAGAIGRPLHFFSLRANFGKFRADSDTLTDLGYHDIYLLRRIFRDRRPVRVAASLTPAFRRGMAAAFAFSVRFAGGPTAEVRLSWLSPGKERRIIVAGAAGILEFRDDRELLLHRKSALLEKGRFVVRDEGTRVVVAADVPANPLRAALAHFVRCVSRREESTLCSLWEGAETVRWQELIRKSAVEGRSVRFRSSSLRPSSFARPGGPCSSR